MIDIDQIDKYQWNIPARGDMLVPAMAYGDRELIQAMDRDGCLEQLRNTACLPGIKAPALAMPDAHQGYGVPIGGVCALDAETGAIPPGGVGYDINCGVRLLRSKLEADGLTGRLSDLADALAAAIPAGVGKSGGIQAKGKELEQLLSQGSAWAVGRGWGSDRDLACTEDLGRLPGADPEAVSRRAKERGASQVGTLGAGNHFVELARVDYVYDQQVSSAFGLWEGQLVLWVHSGSRGLGHQVCDDYIKLFSQNKTTPPTKDRQLVAAPFNTALARSYLGAMAAAANFAFANRQVLAALASQALGRALGLGPAGLGLGLVYDLAHNIAKQEHHHAAGRGKPLWILRKGATRALGPGHRALPAEYRPTGQPVLLPGDMGRASYVLVGTKQADQHTFSSSAHGAGRRLSRTRAKKQAKGRRLDRELADRWIQVRAASRSTLAEEMPEAYKDAAQVVEALHGSGVAKLVARTRPLVVIKG